MFNINYVFKKAILHYCGSCTDPGTLFTEDMHIVFLLSLTLTRETVCVSLLVNRIVSLLVNRVPAGQYREIEHPTNQTIPSSIILLHTVHTDSMLTAEMN